MNAFQRPSWMENLPPRHAPKRLALVAGRHASRGATLRALATLATNLGAQDWIVLGYFVVIALALARGEGAGRAMCLRWVALDLGIFTTGLAIVHGGVLSRPALAAVVHRMLLVGLLVAAFLQLRQMLPTVTSRVLDPQIAGFDLQVFGYEPALAWDRFVTPRTVEWFAFFYFSYFVLIALHVLVVPFLVKDPRVLVELAIGVTLVYCAGQLTYTLVPGFGPYAHFAGQFAHPLVGGFWWGCVERTVHAGGALKDIFPSLHTAAPTFLAVFSFRHRRLAPFRVTWPVMAFFATQIVLATMFLRWHYLADIVAGLALVAVATIASTHAARWQSKRGAERGQVTELSH